MPQNRGQYHMMKKILFAVASSFILAPASHAMEARFSAMVADVETGFILTADRIDSPRDPSLLGRLATLTLATQDLADGAILPDETVRTGRDTTARIDDAMQITAIGEQGYRAHMTGLVNRVGQNAQIFGLRLDGVSETAGLQATAMRVVRGKDGGPAFDGYTTPRDMVRLATSLSRAFPASVDRVFSPATGNITGTHMWLYQEGMCLLSADGPKSGRELIAVLTGAPGQDECLEAAAEMIARDDMRVSDAREDRR